MTQKEKNKGGRPKKVIDEKLVYDLAMMHCTVEEIAACVGCTRETIYQRFSDIIEKGKEEGKSSLRRCQWLQAKKGNVPMLIWLGKQLLGQKDKSPEELALPPVTHLHISNAPYVQTPESHK